MYFICCMSVTIRKLNTTTTNNAISCMLSLFQLVMGYIEQDRCVKSVLRKHTFYIMPVANPDGYQYSRDVVRS